jgi:cytochrome c
LPQGDKGVGVYILRASYKDHGANAMPPITSEDVVSLRSPVVSASDADVMEFVRTFKISTPPIELAMPEKSGAYIAYKNVDLTGIKELVFTINCSKERQNPGGKVEVRIGSPKGQKIGESQPIMPLAGETNSMVPSQVSAKLEDVTGLQDVYLVFVNPAIKEDATLFMFINAQFRNEILKQ